MTRIVIRVLPKEEANVAEVLKKIFFSGIEGVLVPTVVEVVSFVKSEADPNSVVLATKSHPSSEIVERRVKIEYSSDHFPLLTLLDHENEMVPEPSEREDLALHLLDTMVVAHGIGLYHGQLNSERVFVHSDDPVCYLSDFFVGKSYNPYICPRDYRGPESILRCNESSSEKADVWAMGCLLYEMLSTEPLFTLPSSKDEVGVTAPVLIMRQVVSIVDRVAQFPSNRSDEGKGVGSFTPIVTNLFTQLEDPIHRAKIEGLEVDGSLRFRKDRLSDGTISEPFVWAIQQCLTFNPVARPSLAFVRDGLMERIGKHSRDEIISEREAAIALSLARLAEVLLPPTPTRRGDSPASGSDGEGSAAATAAVQAAASGSNSSAISDVSSKSTARSSAPLARLIETIKAQHPK